MALPANYYKVSPSHALFATSPPSHFAVLSACAVSLRISHHSDLLRHQKNMALHDPQN